MAKIEELRAQKNSRAVEAAIQQLSAEAIAELIPQTTADDRFLRIALRTNLTRLWPRSSDEYQNACFFLAAARVEEGKRAYATEIGIAGNEYATLNDSVLATHIQSPDGNYRVAAAQMMRPQHLGLLEKHLHEEKDESVRERLHKAGRRIAGERGAPPSALLSGDERLAQLVRLFGRNKGWLRWNTASECFGLDASSLQNAASLLPVIHSNADFFFVAEGARTPPPLDPEDADKREVALRLAFAAPLKRAKQLASKHALALVKLWLRAQTSLWLPELRYWLGLSEVAAACEGVTFRSKAETLCVRAGQAKGELDCNAMLVVKHPIDGSDSWTKETPLWQSDRPVFRAEEMPDYAETAIPFADWTKRTKALGYAGVREQRAVVRSVRAMGNVQLSHSGHGHGYGKEAQTITSLTFPQTPRAAVSEVIWDVRRLLGLDPLKRPKQPKK